jgi:hydrogenase nickel incorporation protein HypB
MLKKVKLAQKILSANEEFASANAKLLSIKNMLCLNMISSPGSGKTSILERTITELKDKMSIAVIEGDVQTEIDAQRIRKTGAPAIQINTEGACHLSAAQVNHALTKLSTDNLDLIFIENVGNLVCPSAFELGESAKVAVLSVPEGDDKPAKYPALFAKAAAVLINKIDLLSVADFNVERAKADVLKLNKGAKIFPVSAKTGEGMSCWYEWLEELTSKRGRRR